MATYTLKSAAAAATNTTVDLFTATGQTLVKSLFCYITSSGGTGLVKIQKNGGSELTLVSFTADATATNQRFKIIAREAALVDSCLFLETGDKLRVTSNGSYTVTGTASYTVIT